MATKGPRSNQSVAKQRLIALKRLCMKIYSLETAVRVKAGGQKRLYHLGPHGLSTGEKSNLFVETTAVTRHPSLLYEPVGTVIAIDIYIFISSIEFNN